MVPRCHGFVVACKRGNPFWCSYHVVGMRGAYCFKRCTYPVLVPDYNHCHDAMSPEAGFPQFHKCVARVKCPSPLPASRRRVAYGHKIDRTRTHDKPPLMRAKISKMKARVFHDPISAFRSSFLQAISVMETNTLRPLSFIYYDNGYHQNCKNGLYSWRAHSCAYIM